MSLRIKEFAKKIIPKPFQKRLVGVWNAYSKIGVSRAKSAIERATDSRRWLKWKDLEELIRKYPKPERYSFDPSPIPDGIKSLELGALDAKTSFHLQRKGFRPTAIDITDSHFTKEVSRSGVSLLVMDAGNLKFKENFFDLVFSYNSFEHFENPEKVLQEALRVLRPGGCLYVSFGPLYPSPMGLHGHELIPIPYMQFLFPRDMLEKFCVENNLGTIEFDTLNGWSGSGFRELWRSYAGMMEEIGYVEKLDTYGIELIIKYPECFKGKYVEFDDLFISAIEGILRKRG